MKLKKIITGAVLAATVCTLPTTELIAQNNYITSGICLSASAAATTVKSGFQSNSVIYTLYNNNNVLSATVTGCSSTATTLTIPKTVSYSNKTYTVTEIKSMAFVSNTKLAKVVMDSATGLKSIGQYAFQNCTKLTEVKLPNQLTSIPGSCFDGCTSLTTCNMPTSLIWLGTHAFAGTKLTSVSFPNSVIRIDNNCFYNCVSLKTVKWPSSLLDIGNSAFQNTALSGSITFPSKTRSIGNNAFSGTKITSVSINDAALTDVGIDAFPYNQVGAKLREKNAANPTKNGLEIFYTTMTKSNQTAKIPNAYRIMTSTADSNVYTYCFVDASDPSKGLIIQNINYKNTAGTVTIPNQITVDGTAYKVTEIADNVLKGNQSVKTVTVGSNVKKIGASFCIDATSLTTVSLPASLEELGGGSFYSASSLATVKFSGTKLQKIGYGAFWNSGWLANYRTKYPKADALVLGNYMIEYYGDKYSGNNQKEVNLVCSGINTGNNNGSNNTYRKAAVTVIGTDAFNIGGSFVKTLDCSGVINIQDRALKACTKLESVYNTNSLAALGGDLVSDFTYKKMVETTNNKDYILFGTALYKWLGAQNQTTADLKGSKLTFISNEVFKDNKTVKQIILPNANVQIEEGAFLNTAVNDIKIWVGSTRYTFNYNNVKNTTAIGNFYELNFRGLEGCPATKNNFLMPMCKSILSNLGLTYYGKAVSTLTPIEQTKIAGTIYRYLGQNLRYIDTQSTSGEYTLYTNKGECGPSARAYAYLLNAAGVTAYLSGSSDHAWTNIEINGQCFNADVCDSWQNISALFLRTNKEIDGIDHHHFTAQAMDPVCQAYGFCGATRTKTPVQIMGDCNHDGVLNATDATMLYKHLYSTDKPSNYHSEYMDLTGDGLINGADLMLLQTRIYMQ